MNRKSQECCKRCEATAADRRLEACSICHQCFCRVCATRRHGKRFCSVSCAEVFFFGGDEEDY